MVIWIKRLARILSFMAFFAVLLAGINPDDPLNVAIGLAAVAKGFAAAMLFWLTGYIVGDIVFKGVLESVEREPQDPLEGGMVQWFREEKERTSPDTLAVADRSKETAPVAK